VEFNVPILSASQVTRGALGSTDVEMSDVAESIGLAATCDFMFGIMRTEELDQMGQLMIKQLKSRYNDVNYYKRFVIGIDIQKFTLYDIDAPIDNLTDVGRTDSSSSKFEGVKELDFS
jgi:hypothetical protein